MVTMIAMIIIMMMRMLKYNRSVQNIKEVDWCFAREEKMRGVEGIGEKKGE